LTITTKSRKLAYSTGKYRRELALTPKPGREAGHPPYSNLEFSGLGPVVSTGQVTASEGHPWKSRNKAATTFDIGGIFTTTKTIMYDTGECRDYTFYGSSGGYDANYNFAYKHHGNFLPYNPINAAGSVPGDISSSDATLNSMGATAVARCKPTNPIADLATFLGETLHDGLPHLIGSRLWKARLSALRDAGEEFLNTEFGWLPFVSDMKDTIRGIHHANSVIEQYERDAGRAVRRHYNFPTQRSSTEEAIAGGVYPYQGPNVSTETSMQMPRGTVYRKVDTFRSTWFSGAFTYHLPSGYDSRNEMDRIGTAAKKVFGIRLTPEVIWNLTPWSWAADWFSNAGDVLSNVSSWKSDGLVMRYGYIMETSIVRHTYRYVPTSNWDFSTPYTGVKHPIPLLILETITKKRRRANPFGFGVSWTGLSPVQLAIAAALGLTHSR